MRRLHTILLTACIAVLTNLNVSAQAPEKKVKKSLPVPRLSDPHAQFYRHRLGIDSLKGGQVAEIQRDYKSGMALLMRDTSLSAEGKRAKMRDLVEAKNAKLRSILSPAQQERIIPSTERTRPQVVKKETLPARP